MISHVTVLHCTLNPLGVGHAVCKWGQGVYKKHKRDQLTVMSSGGGGRAVEDRGSEKGMTSHYICSGTQLESLKNSWRSSHAVLVKRWIASSVEGILSCPGGLIVFCLDAMSLGIPPDGPAGYTMVVPTTNKPNQSYVHKKRARKCTEENAQKRELKAILGLVDCWSDLTLSRVESLVYA